MKENADHKENEEKEWASSSGARCVLCVGILLFIFYSGWIPKEARGETNGWSAAAESGHQDNGLEIKLCCASWWTWRRDSKGSSCVRPAAAVFHGRYLPSVVCCCCCCCWPFFVFFFKKVISFDCPLAPCHAAAAAAGTDFYFFVVVRRRMGLTNSVTVSSERFSFFLSSRALCIHIQSGPCWESRCLIDSLVFPRFVNGHELFISLGAG